MGNTYGFSVLEQTGRSIQVTADGFPELKHAGLTIDWTTIAAVAGADLTLLDGVVVKIGEKHIRYGQVLTKITASAKYGPFDPAAVDGRQTLTRGECYIANETIKEDELASDHPPVLEGGRCFLDRILATSGAASLAAGPTITNLLAAFPRLLVARE